VFTQLQCFAQPVVARLRASELRRLGLIAAQQTLEQVSEHLVKTTAKGPANDDLEKRRYAPSQV
jgi:hypothetical protein